MATERLPELPDLGQLRTRARGLQRAVRAGDAAALSLVAEHAPRTRAAAAFTLGAAQTVIARHYGFRGWPDLRRHVQIIAGRTWVMPAPDPDESAADTLLRLACLNFTDDDPARRQEAARRLHRHPLLPARDLSVAAACADVDQARRRLEADPGSAARPGGPFGWSPLMYLAYARHDLEVSRAATLETARVLLEAGADPNDGQALYNRMFGLNDDHLRILFEFGLGQETGGPWHRALGDALESPQVMLLELLDWAVSHDQRERVALLAAHGVDVIHPITVRRRSTATEATPLEIAVLNGHLELADRLCGCGATEPRSSPAQQFIGRVLAGERDVVATTAPEVIAEARAARRGVIVWAAARGSLPAVELLVAAGFDVNAYGRADTPVKGRWMTALHVAAQHGNLALAQRLLALGADPQLRDKHHRATALDWARHFDQPQLVDLLTPVTLDEPGPDRR